MSPVERRQELLEVLCRRRHDTYGNLAQEFGVSKMTIRRDVAELMCSYPIETIHGGRHGCVKVMDGFYLTRRKHMLTPKQSDLLRKLRSQLEGDALGTLDSILSDFAP